MWPSWKKTLPVSENSVFLLTYPLPASSNQCDRRLNPCSPAGDSERLRCARWEGRAGYVLLICGETAPRRNAKLLQRLIRVKGFLSFMALCSCTPPSAQGTCLQRAWPFRAGGLSGGVRGKALCHRHFWKEREWHSQGEELAVGKAGEGRDFLPVPGESNCKVHRS